MTPRMVRAVSSVTVAPEKAMTWSNALCASRSDPSAIRLIRSMTACGTCTFSPVAIRPRCAAISACGIFLNSKCWQRDRIVSGSFR